MAIPIIGPIIEVVNTLIKGIAKLFEQKQIYKERPMSAGQNLQQINNRSTMNGNCAALRTLAGKMMFCFTP